MHIGNVVVNACTVTWRGCSMRRGVASMWRLLELSSCRVGGGLWRFTPAFGDEEHGQTDDEG